MEPVLYNIPHLLALIITGILDFETPTLGCNLLGGERPPGMSPSGIRPPLLYGSYIRLINGILMIEVRHGDCVDEWCLVSHGCCLIWFSMFPVSVEC